MKIHEQLHEHKHMRGAQDSFPLFPVIYLPAAKKSELPWEPKHFKVVPCQCHKLSCAEGDPTDKTVQPSALGILLWCGDRTAKPGQGRFCTATGRSCSSYCDRRELSPPDNVFLFAQVFSIWNCVPNSWQDLRNG